MSIEADVRDVLDRNEMITEVEMDIATIHIKVGVLYPMVTLRFYRHPGSTTVWFDQSHYIHTPLQGGPYMTSRPCNDDFPSALRQVVRGFADYYNPAIKDHTPDDGWLVENGDFRG